MILLTFLIGMAGKRLRPDSTAENHSRLAYDSEMRSAPPAPALILKARSRAGLAPLRPPSVVLRESLTAVANRAAGQKFPVR